MKAVLESASYVGRLAPSPTGLLHLGHARTFLLAHDRARNAGGKLWFRDEDLDRQRSRPEFAVAMREDLLWLGLTWDAEVRQSERLPLYSEAMQQLVVAGYAYPCYCSRKDLQQATQAPHEDAEDEPVYSGRCRPLLNPSAPDSAAWNPNLNYRFRVPEAESIAFVDGHFGPQRFVSACDATADFGDFLIWRRDGLPSYQLACVVDDAAMGITEVVRGADLLKSTARQILLQRALALQTPAYYHCDLMRDESGLRLAKRHDALSLRALREQGVTPEELCARLLAK
jgi:glutamyl/glutaminyl-tRNA synthetase